MQRLIVLRKDLPKGPGMAKRFEVMAVAEFTQDMAETLQAVFTAYAVEGIVRLEVTTHGIWLVHPGGSRQFLGAARVFELESNSVQH